MSSGMALTGDTVLRVENLHVWFPLRRSLTEIIKRMGRRYVRAVDGVSFSLREGEILCLVGESGCGKTTTGKAVMGLVKATKGSIYFRPSPKLGKLLEEQGVRIENGFVDIARLSKRLLRIVRRELQLVYQDPYSSLNPRFTIRYILEEPLIIHRVGDEETRLKMVTKMLEAVRLTPVEDFLERYPHELSGGQRQRVAIAKAFILNPRVVVADEPVSMLDVSIRAEILELLLELKKRYNTAMIFITHDLAVARYICDRIAVMYLGKIVEMGPAIKVIEEPLHPYTRALVSAIPEPNPENRKRFREVPIKGEVPSAVNIPAGCRFRPRCVAYDKNASVRPQCEAEDPPMVEVEPERYVACWLYT